MKKFLFTVGLGLAVFTNGMAQAGEVIKIKTLGMVCDFCAQSVLKVFEKEDGVKNIDVNLNDALVTVTMEDGFTLTDEQVKKNIEYGGYNVESIVR